MEILAERWWCDDCEEVIPDDCTTCESLYPTQREHRVRRALIVAAE